MRAVVEGWPSPESGRRETDELVMFLRELGADPVIWDPTVIYSNTELVCWPRNVWRFGEPTGEIEICAQVCCREPSRVTTLQLPREAFHNGSRWRERVRRWWSEWTAARSA